MPTSFRFRSIFSRRYAAVLAAMVSMILAASSVWADRYTEERQITNELDPAIRCLYDLVGSQEAPKNFDPERITAVLDFVVQPKEPGFLYYMDKINGSPSAYYEFDIPIDLSRFLQYCYNPDIPDSIFCPSSIRYSDWRKVNGTLGPFPKLSQYLPNYTNPLVVTGIEYMENTPDLSSGAFFAYDLLRTVILYRHNGHHVLLSISKQTGPSQVGKKGLIIGDDNAWNYLYTDQEGLTRPGLGWVRSQIYDSFSIMVYYEQEGKIRCGAFKWLKAGWAGINFVKKSHIHLGLQRFAQAYQKIFSSPLPEPETMENFFSRLKSLSPERISQIAELRFELQKKDLGEKIPSDQVQLFECLDKNTCRDDDWSSVAKSGLTVEYLKYILGMTDLQRLHRLLGHDFSRLLSGLADYSR